MRIRPALPQDNAQILALLGQVAVVTAAESYRLEREPDAFALTRFQGINSQLLVAAEAEQILGLVGVAIDRVWLDGEIREIAYSSEMRVLPAARGRGLGELLQKASLTASRNAIGEPIPLFNTVMQANPVGMRMNRYLAEADLPPVCEIAEVITCFWPTLLGTLAGRPIALFRPATSAD